MLILAFLKTFRYCCANFSLCGFHLFFKVCEIKGTPVPGSRESLVFFNPSLSSCRYNVEEEGGCDDLDQGDNGWKTIHTDVFRFPPFKSLLCAVLGVGAQFLTLATGETSPAAAAAFVSSSRCVLSLMGSMSALCLSHHHHGAAGNV